MAHPKAWTDEDHKLLVSVANTGISMEQIRQQYFPHRTYNSINGRLSLYKIKNEYKSRKYSQNNKFWSTPNENNSYWAGVMMADGHIEKTKGHSKALAWSISAKDENLMLKFREDSESDAKIDSWTTISEKTGIESRSIRMRVHCQDWIKDLENNFKIINNKGYRTDLPDIKEELIWCFIRGYIDGDGYISYCKIGSKSNPNKKCLRIGIASESKIILEKIMNLVDSKFFARKKQKRGIIKCKGEKTSVLRISGQKAVQMFLFMSRLNVPCLDRKWKNPKILELVREEINNNPDAYKNFL
jgi:hypothetical protein